MTDAAASARTRAVAKPIAGGPDLLRTGGTGGTTTTSSTTTVPDECAVPADQPGPYAVTIRFVNPADSPVGASVYLRQDCLLNYEVRGCGDGYAAPLALSGICTSDCAQADECIQCGACPELGVEIPPGSHFETEWDGTFVTFDQNAVGCTCHVDHVAPAQTYRIGVPVFPSEAAAIMNMADFQVLTLFDLPTPRGVVEVELVPPPP